MIGRTLAHFEITAKLGEGGMGEVYRAADTRLGREVAIKVLPEAFVADPERLARFEREAKVVASLNHPNIAAIHGLEKADGIQALVMELVEGEDLAQRIARRPVALDEALAIASQIAEGLEAAHERGIVHRDLKPANVMLTPEGQVKILDFGLAKAMESGPGADSSPLLTQSPTITHQMTQAGMLMGTAAYMSPEQARGQEADKRADIWAFGVVLFELLTGQRLFAGPSVTDVLAAVIRAELDLDGLPVEVPGPIRRLLARCLDRDEKNRLRDIGEARIRIAEVLTGSAGAVEEGSFAGEEVAPTLFRRLAPWLLAAAAAAVGVIAGAVFLGRSQPTDGRDVVHSSLRLPKGVRLAGWSSPAVALSPDEQTVAFVGFRDGRQELYLRRLGEPEAAVLPDSDGAEGPFFSPDSRWVGFGAGAISGRSDQPRLLKRAPVGGGSTQSLVPLKDYAGGSWGEDGYIYYVDGFLKDQLLRVRDDGGDPESVFSDERGAQLADTIVAWPQHLPGGRRLLLTTLQGARGGEELAILDLETGELESLGQSGTFARYAKSGHLLFSRTDGALRAAPFDPASARILGAPVPLVPDIAFTSNLVPVIAVGGKGSALYATGFVRGSDRVMSRLVRVDSSGTVEQLPFDPGTFTRGLSLDPDGRRLVTATWDGPLWIYDLVRGTRLKLADAGLDVAKGGALWSPDGKTIVFSAEALDQNGILLFAQAADGTGEARLLFGELAETWATGWTPDSRQVLYRHWPATGKVRYGRVSVSAEEEPVAMPAAGVVSPDGNWMAYQSGETGRLEVYLQPFPEGGAVTPVSTGGGASPRWSPAGDELYFVRDCQFFAISVMSAPQLRLGTARPLFEHCDPTRRGGSSYDVGRDGSFYLLEAVPDSGIVTSFELVLNWTDTLAGEFGND